MAIPLCGTFKYFVNVPREHPHDQAAPWPVHLDELVPLSGSSLLTHRLVGLSPRLLLADAGASAPQELGNPAPQTIRLTLVAHDTSKATSSEASFLIARDLFLTLRHGDTLHMARTQCGGMGLSAIRGGRLIFGVGAVRAVPLGNDIKVKCPNMKKATKQVCQTRNPDPEVFKLAIEVTVGAQAFTAYEGRSQLGEYQLSIVHGYRIGFPGDDECVSIARTGECPSEEAEFSARLLDHKDGVKLGPGIRVRKAP